MDPKELITMLENRISHNNQQRAAAYTRGDIASVQAYDEDNQKTQISLDLLRAAF